MIESILIAFSICLANTAGGYFIAVKARKKKEQSEFTSMVLGSIVVRYIIVLICVWLCLDYLKVQEFPFGLTFILSTFFLIFIEILFLNYQSNFLNLQKAVSNDTFCADDIEKTVN